MLEFHVLCQREQQLLSGKFSSEPKHIVMNNKSKSKPNWKSLDLNIDQDNEDCICDENDINKLSISSAAAAATTTTTTTITTTTTTTTTDKDEQTINEDEHNNVSKVSPSEIELTFPCTLPRIKRIEKFKQSKSSPGSTVTTNSLNELTTTTHDSDIVTKL